MQPGNNFIIGESDLVLITGAAGFIGSRVVKNLLDRGFRNLRCLARRPITPERQTAESREPGRAARLEWMSGNLLSREDCAHAAREARVIFHLAAGRGEKSFPGAYANSVVTTRNLLDAALEHGRLARFVNVSSFSVYSNRHKPRWRMLDESCPVEEHPDLRGDAYSFAKIKQEELVSDYRKRFGVPCVTVRPGYVYGPGNLGITGRVGTNTFGLFLHMGGPNPIPFTYVDNCAEAIALAGLKPGIDGEVFNVVDDELPSSRRFLSLYKRHVRRFPSLYMPHFLSYMLCWLWERYAERSARQLPPVYSRQEWHAYWKKTRYSNKKLKARMGWTPSVPTAEGLRRYFAACREAARA